MGAEHYRRAVVCFRHGDGAYRSRGVLHRFGLVRHRGEPADAPARSAQLRLEEPGRDQRAAHGEEGRRGAHACRRCRQRLARGVARAGMLGGDVPAAGLAVFLGHLYPGVPPLPGRQGRRDRGGRALRLRLRGSVSARSRPGSSSRCVLPLFVARFARRRAAFAPLLSPGFSAWTSGVVIVAGGARAASCLAPPAKTSRVSPRAPSRSSARKKASPPDPNAASR